MNMMAASLQIDGWKRLTWPHPEWWTIAISVVAWLAILAQPLIATRQATHDHSHHHTMSHGLPALSSVAFAWMLMVVAMMFPMILESIRILAARSLWKRRHRAILGFLTGYLALWTLFGIAATFAISALQAQVQLESTHAAALGLGVAIVWQLMPAKRRAILGCHRLRPIVATGWRADRDCLRTGWMIGVSCLVSCWALMLACILSGHSLPVMFFAMAVSWTERHRARPNQRLLCSGLVLLAMAQLMLPYVHRLI